MQQNFYDNQIILHYIGFLFNYWHIERGGPDICEQFLRNSGMITFFDKNLDGVGGVCLFLHLPWFWKWFYNLNHKN